MIYKDFEDYLKEQHSHWYLGLDDDMPDNYRDWLCDLSVDEWIDLGEGYYSSRVNPIINGKKIPKEQVKEHIAKMKFCNVCHLELQDTETSRCTKCKENPMWSITAYYGKKGNV
jgi:hypothetical protein